MSVPMIESVHFQNFKALRDTTLPLGRFTLIVGANGSGKSTAMRAIQMMSISTQKPLSRRVRLSR